VQLALSPDQRILARLFPDGTISWKEFETESTLGRVTPEDPAVRRILFSPCGKELLYSQGRHLRVIPLGQELVW
jgi:hypothetical protein